MSGNDAEGEDKSGRDERDRREAEYEPIDGRERASNAPLAGDALRTLGGQNGVVP